MEDKQIIDLYWARSEAAILETDKRYGSFCRRIAYNILYDREDSEECVSDTYFQTWNAIPPRCPDCLAGFLGKLTRNLALSRYRREHARKRGGGAVVLALEELEHCIPAAKGVEETIEEKRLREVLNCFLSGLPQEARKLFLQRYWAMSGVKEIADLYGISESKVKMSLLRTRKKLKAFLESEGVAL